MQLNELTNLVFELLESKKIDALVDKYPDLKIAVDAGIENVQYLNWIIKRGGGEPIEDIVGVVRMFDANRRRLKDKGKSSDIYSYKSPGDIRRAFEELDTSGVDDEVKASETDILGTFGDWTVVMPHSIQSSCAWGAGTTWCTAATKTQNMFLNYVGRKSENIVLYYLIQSGQSTRINPNSKISIGFINGNPVLDGKRGGVTVNADNEGLNDADLRKILGSNYQSIMGAMIEHAQGIGGTHPAKKQMERAAKDVGFFKSIIKKMKSDTLFDFFNQLKYYNPSEEVMAFEPEILSIASTSPTEHVRQTVASNPKTPPEALAKLAGDLSYTVRNWVVNNPNTPPEALAKLAAYRSYTIRSGVARNPNTPPEALAKLAATTGAKANQGLVLTQADANKIRAWVAGNPNTPPEVLAKLAGDSSYEVRGMVANNLSTPPETLAKLTGDSNSFVRSGLASNPNTPPEVLAKLAGDSSYEVRGLVADNPSYQAAQQKGELNEMLRWKKLAGISLRD